MTLLALKNSCLSPAFFGAALLALASPALANLTISPPQATVASGGDTNTVEVISTDSSVTWTASSDQPWLTFTSPTSGMGNGKLLVYGSRQPNQCDQDRECHGHYLECQR